VSLAESTNNSRVKESIRRDFYVDDYLSGGNTIEETVQLGKEVDTILKFANFHLRGNRIVPKCWSKLLEFLQVVVH
jgi:hypothetical protein